MKNNKISERIQEEIEKLLNLSEEYIEEETGFYEIEKISYWGTGFEYFQ